MTMELKNKIVGGVVVGLVLLTIQVATTAFSGRWIKGAKSNDFVEKTEYTKNREADLKKAFNYTDKELKDCKSEHIKDHTLIDQKIKNVETIQSIQITNIEKSLKSINDWIDKQ